MSTQRPIDVPTARAIAETRLLQLDETQLLAMERATPTELGEIGSTALLGVAPPNEAVFGMVAGICIRRIATGNFDTAIDRNAMQAIVRMGVPTAYSPPKQ